MTAPPFPVPRGMDWDPVKRRFFKKPPAQAKVTTKLKSPTRQLQEEESRTLEKPILYSSPFRLTQDHAWAKLPGKVSLTASRSSLSLSSSRQNKRVTVESILGHAELVSITSLIPWSQQGALVNISECSSTRNAAIRSLQTTSSMGSLISFSNGDGNVFLMDISHITSREPSSAIGLQFILSLLQPNTTLDRNDIILLKSLSDRSLGSWNAASHSVYSFDDDHLAILTGESVIFGQLSNLESTQGPFPGYRRRQELRVRRGKIIQRLCVRGLHNSSTSRGEGQILAYATQRQVGVVRLKYAPSSGGLPEKEKVVVAYQLVTSDVISLELLPLGTTLLVGLRNGTVLQHSVKTFFKKVEQRKIGLYSTEAAIFSTSEDSDTHLSRSSGFTLGCFGKGAITHIRAVSANEIVIAYSSGEMVLVFLNQTAEPTIRFQGHVNSWSLDLPMAIDPAHRLLAVAGQDRKVRIWSLDRPLPLCGKPSLQQGDTAEDILDLAKGGSFTKTLHDSTFSSPITGLAFCQRRCDRSIQGGSRSPRGLPALAVSCLGNEIGFFE